MNVFNETCSFTSSASYKFDKHVKRLHSAVSHCSQIRSSLCRLVEEASCPILNPVCENCYHELSFMRTWFTVWLLFLLSCFYLKLKYLQNVFWCFFYCVNHWGDFNILESADVSVQALQSPPDLIYFLAAVLTVKRQPNVSNVVSYCFISISVGCIRNCFTTGH